MSAHLCKWLIPCLHKLLYKVGRFLQSVMICLCSLRSPKSPDELADMGLHSFTYAAMPHTGTILYLTALCSWLTNNYGFWIKKVKVMSFSQYHCIHSYVTYGLDPELCLDNLQLAMSLLPLLYMVDHSSFRTYHYFSDFPLPSSRQHLSNDDSPEDKRKYYQNCSMLYCVLQLCTVILTDIRTLQSWLLVMVALCNRCGHYIFVLWFLSSSFFLA